MEVQIAVFLFFISESGPVIGPIPNESCIYFFPKWELKIPNGRLFFLDLSILFISNPYISSTLVNIILNTLLKHFLAKQEHRFPNFSQYIANFPNPKGPGPIPKMGRKNTGQCMAMVTLTAMLTSITTIMYEPCPGKTRLNACE